ncbi:hypothetical protein ACFX14_019265 [Malus domestica]
MQSQEQTLDSVNEKEKEEENPRGESPLKTKVEATQVEDEKVKETKDYFWLMSNTRSMATELIVLRSDLTSLFVDGPIDTKLINGFFYIMSEN